MNSLDDRVRSDECAHFTLMAGHHERNSKMRLSRILIADIVAASHALGAGPTVMAIRKGVRHHRISEDLIVIAALIMSATDAYVALVGSQRLDVLAGAIAFYLVATAWLIDLR
jgi:hypothetical protein